MSTSKKFKSFEELFDKINFKKGREGRSVYSPAAYLSDLLQLLEDKFSENSNFFDRRADVKDIMLNGEKAFSQIAYLDLVNKILEHKIASDGSAYEILKEKTYPTHLPFNIEEEQYKQYLKYLEVDPSTIYQMFAEEPDANIVAREYLKLTEEQLVGIIQEPTDGAQFFQQYYNVSAEDMYQKLSSVEQFLEITNISLEKLFGLLFQNLSKISKSPDGTTEELESLAPLSFLNHGTSGFAFLENDETKINWGEISQMSAPIDESGEGAETVFFSPDGITRLQKASRLIRLSKTTGMDIVDLELILRTVCGNTLNRDAIQKIAVIKQIQDRFDLSIEESCALVSDMNNSGLGDEKEPKDLFNQVYNNNFTSFDPAYILGSGFVPKKYSDSRKYQMLWATGDILSTENSDYRKRIGKALHISEKDIVMVAQKFRDHFGEEGAANNLFDINVEEARPMLNVLYRLSKLVEVLDTTYQELFHLFDLLEKDTSIQKFALFSVLIPYNPTEVDCYKIIQGKATDSVNASLWLTQILIGVIQWMQHSDFSGEELKQILTGEPADEKTAKLLDEQKLNFLNTLYQQIKPTFFSYKNFISENFDSRAARSIYRTISEPSQNLVSEKDNRLVHFEEKNAKIAAAKAIGKLDVFSKEDFLGLGIEEKMVDKIFNNLIIKGYINGEGGLIEEAFPKNMVEFKINSSSVDEKKALFEAIQQLVKEEYHGNGHSNGNGETENVSFFLSDLEELELPETRTIELYDNLMFNGYIDEEGNLIHPDFFIEEKNVEEFEPNANIDIYSAKVYNKIKTKIDCFYKEKLILTKEAFQHLPLKAIELEDLMENLQFNEYIDDKNTVVDKKHILELQVDEINLAIQFYPHRAAILAAIQQAIIKFKIPYFTISRDILKDVADEIIAEMVHHELEQNHLEDGKMSFECVEFFRNDENLKDFHISPYFTEIFHQTVFKAIQKNIIDFEKYQINEKDLGTLELEGEYADEVLDFLNEEGYLENGKIPANQLAYFLNIDNALSFDVEGYSDYNKDLFFLIHKVAKTTEASVNEIYNNIKTTSDEQHAVVMSTVGEYAEMSADVTEIVLSHIFKNRPSLVEALVVPVLNQVDEKDRIASIPSSNAFNIALQRLRQSALLVSKLRLNQAETAVAFTDQSLAEKFPEKLHLPEGMDRFDALLESGDQIYIFKEKQYWIYSRDEYELLESAQMLTTLSENFGKLQQVDATFTDAKGTEWLIGRTAGDEAAGVPPAAAYFCKNKKGEWETKETVFGKVESNFENLEQIDASFVDQDGKIYLFAGNQYMRYSSGLIADEGYPKLIKGNWINELDFDLPEKFYESIDASFSDVEGVTYIFKDDYFVTSGDSTKEIPINEFWGRVKNNFEDATRIDAAFVNFDRVYLFSGDQVIAYSDSIENDEVIGVEGSLTDLRTVIPGLPDDFEGGIDAVLAGADEQYYVFNGKKYATLNVELESDEDSGEATPQPIEGKWGILKNNIAHTGQVDAAMAGLDGRTYIFSGDQYYRYSRADYSKVDEGYPHTISKDWGGLASVEASFVLDGKTYLFGKDQNDTGIYVQYSTNDYSTPDEGFPKATEDNWWNLPKKLTDQGFNTPDAVLVGNDKNTYLFKGASFVYYDTQHRWWAEPEAINQRWDSIPFQKIAAGFTGKDGRTYIFEDTPTPMEEMEGEMVLSASNGKPKGLRFVRYSDKNYNKIDDRFPKAINSYWGKVVNNIAKTKTVDAAVTLLSRETIVAENGDESIETYQHTYLFSGNQFFRYTGNTYDKVDEGYPKMIKTGLKEEPRFKNLQTDFVKGIDAIFADQRNVYLFKNGECVVVSEEKNKTYTKVVDVPIQTAFIDQGSVYGMNDDNWMQLSALENKEVSATPKLPPVLRDVPLQFRAGVDAVLNGIDKNTYVFIGDTCYNASLEKAYPIGEEWGRAANLFQMEGTVDAGFVGRDGKTYLFSGDQFISYTPTKGDNSMPAFADSPPKSIAEHWGGLENVWVAFVKDDKTYICESTDEDGNFRYHCYSSDDYSKPDSETPMEGDIYWWDMPEDYIEEGFDFVNAVLFEEDNMFLLNDTSFVQYNKTEEIWTYPKPLQRIWRNLPEEHAKFEGVKTAFTGSDNITRFFSDHTFVEYKNLPNGGGNVGTLEIKKIESHWGIENNNIVKNNKVDAAVVIGGKTTFLFSGNQYVRYSEEDYQFIDAGYPKLIVGNLRSETGFEKISEELEEALGNEASVTAILANQHNIYIFEKDNCHVFSDHASRTYETSLIGNLKNNISKNNKIDAAYLSPSDETFIFSGDQFFKYSTSDYELVDTGYPKSIAHNLAPEAGFQFLGDFADHGVDAIFKAPHGETYLFKGNRYHASDEQAKSFPLEEVWGEINNQFIDNSDKQALIDAAFTSPDGMTYFFKGNQYVRYSDLENEYADEGFPKRIRDNWGDLFTGHRDQMILIGNRDFEAKINGAWVLEGNTYFAKGNEYVRYSNSDFTKMDSIYPQPFTSQWVDRNDFLLNDLKIVSRYKELNDQYQGGDATLTNFFYEGIGYQKEPFGMLAEIFDWNVEEVKWLKVRNVFLRPENDMEVQFDLEQVLGMYDIFAVANKMGMKPSKLFAKVWTEKFSNQNIKAARTALYAQLGLNNSEPDWQILSRQMHDEMNLIRRDALMPYLIEITDGVEDARDLFEHLLIDVEMGSDAKTSEIKEATAAVQLYFHRYFVSLEETDNVDEEEKQKLKEWWKWMKNYRVWEANRKVFLYPENYIRPELRDTKTPEFQQLEDSLLQGIVNHANVESNYKSYIDNFAIVGNLKIAGANVYRDEKTDEDVLLLFGHTRTEPAEYYYRTGRFSGDIAEWSAWEKTEVNIPAARVFPVYANGRVLVFWIEIEEYEDSKGTLNRQNEKSEVLEVNTDNTTVKHRAHVKFSYLNHNLRWSPPQNVKRNINLTYKLDAAYVEGSETRVFSGEYCLSSSSKNPAGAVKLIAEYPEYKNLTSLHNGIDSVTTFKHKRYFFKGKNYVIQSISSGEILAQGNVKDLIKSPNAQPTIVVVSLGVLGKGVISVANSANKNPYTIPEYFDAAFTIEDEVFCLIDKNGNYIFFEEDGNQLTPIQSPTTISTKFGGAFNFEFFIHTIANKGGQFAPADGVFKENDTYYVLRNGQYECYNIDEFGMLKVKEGFPKSIKGNLAFNMDKFFNRLYVVWHKNDGGYVSLNYTTSRGDFLLSGKLAPDFIFEEFSFKNNIDERFLKGWKRYLTNNFSKGYDDSAANNAINKAGKIDKSLKAIITANKYLKDIHQHNKGLIDATGHARTNTKSKFETAINSALKLNGIIKNTDSDKEVLNKIPNYATELNTLFTKLQEADTDRKKNNAKTKMDALITEILEHQKDVRDVIFKKKENLKSSIEKERDNIFALNIPSIHSSHALLVKNSKEFNRIITNLDKTISLPADLQDENLFTALTNSNNSALNDDTAARVAIENAFNFFSFENPRIPDFPKVATQLNAAKKNLASAATNLTTAKTEAKSIGDKSKDSLEGIIDNLNALEERIFGRFDLFHKKANLGIENTSSNFSFGFIDWYVFEKAGGTFLCRPRGDNEEGTYEIIRLTTNSAYQLSSKLFTGGVKSLLELKTQEIDESPAFGAGKDIPYNAAKIEKDVTKTPIADRVPTSINLDFQGANKTYYWELFFHAPFLIAQALNTAQKFEEAKEWYEYIFDPTKNEVWQFLPFNNKDLEGAFISDPAQLKKYYNDPFDPHAIAGLRINAYRKAIVMNYIDNLLDWGDMLFRQYTMESINEARMLYVLAYDLLGKKPQSAGNRILTDDQTYQNQKDVNNIDLEIWDLENEDDGNINNVEASTQVGRPLHTIHSSNLSAYFFIPENDLFLDYWDRVEDRLYKIRQSLNIKGLKQPLPLFQPPIDPMAMVLAASSGAGISSAMSSMNVTVPHYRFNFMINKAQELVGKLNQFGGELLGTLEKKDAEELNILQNRQEGIILSMSRALREGQLAEAKNQLKSLKENMDDAKRRLQYHEDTIEAGALPAEEAQMGLMAAAAVGHVVATTFNTLSVIAFPFPEVTIGPFSFGTSIDPGDIGEGLSKVGEAAASASEGMSILGELAGMVAQQQRMLEDWEFQRDATKHEIAQMELEIEGAEMQVKMAQLEMEIYDKEVENHESIENFFKEKFTTQELYQWMASRMSGMYFQTYQQAYDMAKYAEKAFQYERGVKASEANFIQPNYWNSQRKGLMAGESLGMDLERMEQAFLHTNERRLEISKNISLVELDPMAYVNLMKKGICDFRLSEALFDYDYQGHYCRQIKSITLTITAAEGQTVNATLTQLNHSTVMEADAKAVKFLLNPKDKQPLSIRNNWRANQQIAISHVDKYDDSNGMFELRFDDDRYLPFEGTGAVSTWRLELNGKRGSYRIKDIKDIVMNVRYTALQGGEAFGNAVKGLLKPYQTAELIDFEQDFSSEWADFLDGDSNDFSITLTKDYFPNMGSNKITGMLAKYELAGEGQIQMMINNDDSLMLKDGKHLETPGVSIGSRGTVFTFKVKGNKENLMNVKLVLGYKATV